ncbi:hypothetical protein GCM10027360_18190 [Amycolatopsis echigonensis]
MYSAEKAEEGEERELARQFAAKHRQYWCADDHSGREKGRKQPGGAERDAGASGDLGEQPGKDELGRALREDRGGEEEKDGRQEESTPDDWSVGGTRGDADSSGAEWGALGLCAAAAGWVEPARVGCASP